MGSPHPLVMAGLVPAIHVFYAGTVIRGGCPRQVHPRAGRRPDGGREHDGSRSTVLPGYGRMDDSTKLDDSKYRFIGKPIPRNEDARLVTGHGRFTADFKFEGETYAAMVRSPHPHARIRGIATDAARKMPGVLGVFTGADCLADKLTPIPHDPLPRT